VVDHLTLPTSQLLWLRSTFDPTFEKWTQILNNMSPGHQPLVPFLRVMFFSTPNETGPFQLEPKIPSHISGSVNGHITLDDFAPEWDHDTDTLASFLAWKSAQHHTESSNNTITSLLEPICQFVRNEIRYQLKNHSTTLQHEMKNQQMETQKQICQLTATIANLAEQVKVLSSCPVPTATATIVKTVMNSPP